MMTSQSHPWKRILRQIPNKRLALAWAARVVGILELLEFIAARREPVVTVLTYHRIALPAGPAQMYYDPVISATPESFRAQIELLARKFQLLTLDDLLCTQAIANVAQSSHKPGVLVTFDDGYRDNYETALPILQRYDVPATFFISTQLVEDPTLPWWDHVAYALKTTRVSTLRVERFEGDTEPLEIQLGPSPSAVTRAAATRAIIGHFVDGTIDNHPWFLDQLSAQARVAIDTRAAGCELFMGWDEVKQLASAGMSIGSHGHSHQAMAKLSDVTQRAELVMSRTLLESATGKEVHALAYPFGWDQTYSPRTQELATEVGYQLAFSATEGVNSLLTLCQEPMALRRLNIGTGDSPLLLRARVLSYVATGRSVF
jgi:peptidoglycan/xylan/chitin deacetylase (PgdA/CDA1 family)